MEAIKPIWEQMPLRPQFERTEKQEAAEFTDIFRSAVSAVKETDAEKTKLQYMLSTGQLDNPAPLMIANTKAQLSVDLLVQLRNKTMEAYNELMRLNL